MGRYYEWPGFVRRVPRYGETGERDANDVAQSRDRFHEIDHARDLIPNHGG